MKKQLRLAFISDTHEMEDRIDVPECDYLFHAGDITFRGEYEKIQKFDDWCGSQILSGNVKREVIAIAGNHDLKAETNPEMWEACINNFTYLKDEMIEIGDPNGRPIKVYGSPWTPRFYDWAFNADRGSEIRKHWDKIPKCDILITHGPPFGVLDKNQEGQHVGCVDLREAILRIRPKIHVCGHIHEGAGLGMLGSTLVINASSCNRRYEPINPVISIMIDSETFGGSYDV